MPEMLNPKNPQSPSSRCAIRVGFILIILVAIASHFWLFSQDHNFSSPDSATYIESAQSLSSGYGFSNAQHQIETARTPGYPLFLVFFLAFGNNLTFVIIVQHLLCILIVAVTYHIAQRVTQNKKIAAISSTLLAIDLPTIIYSNKILSETLYTTALFVLVWTLFSFTRGPQRIFHALLLGLFGGFCVLIRPVGIFFLIPAMLYLGLYVSHKKRSLILATFAAAYLLLPAVWMYRNYLGTGQYLISSISSENMLYYRAAGTLAIRESGDFAQNLEQQQNFLKEQVYRDIALETHADPEKMLHAQKAPYFDRLGVRIIMKNPLSYLKLSLRGLALILLGGGSDSVSKLTGVSTATVRMLLLCYTVPCFILALLGLRYFYRTQANLCTLVVLTLIYFVGISAGGESDSRFRVPVMPFYVIAVAYGIIAIFPLRSVKK